MWPRARFLREWIWVYLCHIGEGMWFGENRVTLGPFFLKNQDTVFLRFLSKLFWQWIYLSIFIHSNYDCMRSKDETRSFPNILLNCFPKWNFKKKISKTNFEKIFFEKFSKKKWTQCHPISPKSHTLPYMAQIYSDPFS